MAFERDNPNNCPVCNWDRSDVHAQQNYGDEFKNFYTITCPRCGEFIVERLDYRPWKLDQHEFLSCAARQSWELGQRLLITSNNARDLIQAHRRTAVTENLDRLLNHLGAKTEHPGENVRLEPEKDYTVIDIARAQDLVVYLQWLQEDKMVDLAKYVGDVWQVTVSRSGWKRLQPVKKLGGVPGTCFVAMWFDPKMNDVYELGIRPAIEDDCGFKAIRIDRTEHNNQITDEIIARIREAEFTVADFSGNRGGVYYEAGFARGLGRTVIHCCHQEDFEARHFDTKLINHIKWATPEDLRMQLARRIKATILPIN